MRDGTFINYLEANLIKLSEYDLRKYEDFEREKIDIGNKWYEWIYKFLWVDFRDLSKRISLGDEKFEFDAFAKDHKRFDYLSNYYGNLYHNSFALNYYSGAFAVLCALLPIGVDFGKYNNLRDPISVGFELVFISVILGIYFKGLTPVSKPGWASRWFGWFITRFRLNRRWHERWLEYRLLAERFRYMEILYPIGIEVANENEHSHEVGTWMLYYFRYRVEKVNHIYQSKNEHMNDIVHDKHYLNRLNCVMKDQLKYHQANTKKMESIHHRLHGWATTLFVCTVVLCGLHFIVHEEAFKNILTLFLDFYRPLLQQCMVFWRAVSLLKQKAFHNLWKAKLVNY